MGWAVLGVGVVAAIGWLYAVYNWVQAVRHRRPELSLARMLFSGMSSFNVANFTPVGRRYQRRFLWGLAVFAAGLLAGIGAAIFAAATVR